MLLISYLIRRRYIILLQIKKLLKNNCSQTAIDKGHLCLEFLVIVHKPVKTLMSPRKIHQPHMFWGIFVLKCCYQYCRLVFFNEQIEKYTTVLALTQIQLQFCWSFLLNLFFVKNSRGLLLRWKYPVAISLVELSHTMTRPINEKWLVLTFMRSRPTLLLEERVEARVLASFDWGKYFLFWVKYEWRWT